MRRAPVNKIIPFSNVDGPGNRTAVFFQGCTFDCLFCHNPETIALCRGCGECVDKCPEGALSRGGDGGVEWDGDRCVQCDACIRACPHDASPRVKWMTVEEVLARIRRSAPYIRGVTASGGECTLYADFLEEMFKGVREMGRTCLIDSNGSFDFERRGGGVLDVCEGVMLDVKAVEKGWSDELTSGDVGMVLKNLDYLLKIGKLFEVRTVVFPGRDRENEETVRFVSRRIGDSCPYKIIRYRPYGVREACRAAVGEEEADRDYAEAFARIARGEGAAGAYVV